jgi:spore coat polysaccharide biosynthesis protein SpsF
LIGIVLQARMGSTRLPGKMLMEMAGRSMLWHNVERLRRVQRADALVVAVPEGEADEPLVRHCEAEGWDVFRGSENDVLGRYYHCALERGFAHTVRATGDCPLVDPEVVDAMIELHLREAADYTSSKDEVGCRVPNGTGLEMFSFAGLERSHKQGLESHHREHINEYIIEHREHFCIAAYRESADKCYPDLDLTVDTPEDFLFVQQIIEAFAGDHNRLTTAAVIAYCSTQKVRT